MVQRAEQLLGTLSSLPKSLGSGVPGRSRQWAGCSGARWSSCVLGPGLALTLVGVWGVSQQIQDSPSLSLFQINK